MSFTTDTDTFAPNITTGVGSYFEATVGRTALPPIRNQVSGITFRDDWSAAAIRNPADPASALWNFELTGSDPDPTNGIADSRGAVARIETGGEAVRHGGFLHGEPSRA